jgi:hypothetical protein
VLVHDPEDDYLIRRGYTRLYQQYADSQKRNQEFGVFVSSVHG